MTDSSIRPSLPKPPRSCIFRGMPVALVKYMMMNKKEKHRSMQKEHIHICWMLFGSRRTAVKSKAHDKLQKASLIQYIHPGMQQAFSCTPYEILKNALPMNICHLTCSGKFFKTIFSALMQKKPRKPEKMERQGSRLSGENLCCHTYEKHTHNPENLQIHLHNNAQGMIL